MGIWILVADFNGFSSAFLDPRGNPLILWTKGGSDPVLPEGLDA